MSAPSQVSMELSASAVVIRFHPSENSHSLLSGETSELISGS